MLESDIVGIDVGQILVDLKAGIVETFHEADGIGLIDIARTCTSCDEVVAGDAEYRNFLDILQGESGVAVLQQHHAFGCALAGDGSMCLQVGLVAEVVATEAWATHDVLQDAAHTGIDILYLEFAAFHLVDDLLGLLDHTGSHQVVAGMNLLGRIALSGPVGHDDAAEAPLVTQDGGEQFAVGLGPNAVQTVVRRHDSPRVRLLDGDFKTLEIDFAKGTLVDDFVHFGAVVLLAVAGKVLDACAYTLALYAANVSGCSLACHNRILAVVFEVASAER